VHGQGQKLGIQLAHAGRKASTLAPWAVGKRGESAVAEKEAGGWPDDVMGPSAIRWSEEGYCEPREMTELDIKNVVNGFGQAARRSVEAGIDVIEIHAAHGYLLSSFLSPISNKRTDKYGGSFENRIRLLVEVIQAVRSAIGESVPLLVRVSSTEWMEDSGEPNWSVDSTAKLAKLFPGLGVDLLDVSTGGNDKRQKISVFNEYQIDIAGKIRKELYDGGIKNLLIGAVGMITEAEFAKSILEDGNASKNANSGRLEVTDEQGAIAKADVVLVGRQFLREPEWVLRVAHKLGVNISWPHQYTWAKFSKDVKL